MTGRSIAIVTAAILAVIVLALWIRARPPRDAGDPVTAVGAPPPAAPSTGRNEVEEPGPPSAAASGTASSVPRFPRRWRRLARAALDRHIAEAGLEGQIDHIGRQQLMTALARVRLSALAVERIQDTNNRLLERHIRTLTEGDQLFREKVGLGIAEFIARLSTAGDADLRRRPSRR